MTQIIRQIACPVQFQKHFAIKPHHAGDTLLIATAFGAGSFATLSKAETAVLIKCTPIQEFAMLLVGW